MRLATCLFSAIAAIAVSALAAPAVHADELQLTPPSGSSVNHPARGMSMEKVEATFGAPTSRVAPVGGANSHQPPITRWEYPGFVVFFENNVVVHSVIVG
jgi:hypothetical protein